MQHLEPHDTGFRAAAAVRRESQLLHLSNGVSALRAHRRAEAQLARLPHGRIRAVVVRRLDVGTSRKPQVPSPESIRAAHGRRALSDFDREDVNSLVCVACHRLGLEDGAIPTREQWREIFREVRREFGTDREAKRAKSAPVITLDPALIAQLEVPDPASLDADHDAPGRERSRVAGIVRKLHAQLLASYSLHESRKRRARFRAELRFLRRLAALAGSRELNEPITTETSTGALRVSLFRFREYLALSKCTLTTEVSA